jgi:hypothetical protein
MGDGVGGNKATVFDIFSAVFCEVISDAWGVWGGDGLV